MIGQPASTEPAPASVHPIPTPVGTNTGPLATAAWLLARGLTPTERNWSAEITLHAGDARFAIEIFAEEWGFVFRHDDRQSWIRVTDIPFVHGHDDFELLPAVTTLRDIANVVREVENRHQLTFDRERAFIRTNVPNAEAAIAAWVAAL